MNMIALTLSLTISWIFKFGVLHVIWTFEEKITRHYILLFVRAKLCRVKEHKPLYYFIICP